MRTGTVGFFTAFSSLMFIGVPCTGAEKSDLPKIDAKAFEAVPSTDRLEFVKRILLARDAHLQNFSYHVIETSNNIDLDDGSKEFMHKADYTVRRLGHAHLMQIETTGPHSKKQIDSAMNWNGKLAKALTHFPDSNEPRGMITDRENENFAFRAYNQILGFRVLKEGPQGGTPMTVAEWVASFPESYNRKLWIGD
jgi:hypothetical protein